ncbi:MAG: hypothetical protein V2I27_11710 [Erythrobacter sp.]|jgi:hypothetical protein|nr:hypothetical protein [Erythrobacter sp.]
MELLAGGLPRSAFALEGRSCEGAGSLVDLRDAHFPRPDSSDFEGNIQLDVILRLCDGLPWSQGKTRDRPGRRNED